MSNEWVESMQGWAAARDYRRRTVVPGRIATPDASVEDGIRERNADFETGIPALQAGQAAPIDTTPAAPVMSLTGGGFYCLFPTSPGDEALGLVSDRSLGPWRQFREPGNVDPINGKRSKVLSDMMVFPFAISAPSGAPETWDRLVLGGPSGVALEVDESGVVTVTKQSDGGGAPTPVASITLEAGGSVTIDVTDGQSVNVGGALAVALAKAQALISAMDTAITAAVSAAAAIVPPNGDGGTAGFTAWQGAWNAAKNNIPTLKAKGE